MYIFPGAWGGVPGDDLSYKLQLISEQTSNRVITHSRSQSCDSFGVVGVVLLKVCIFCINYDRIEVIIINEGQKHALSSA